MVEPMSDLQSIKGIMPASLTMFDRDGEIDEPATARHIEYLLSSGVHGLVAAGTSGEFIAMTVQERMRVIELIVDTVSGRVPVVAATGHYSTRLTIDMTQQAERMGAAAVLLILPYFQNPPKRSIIEHYRAVRHNTDLPLLIYNNPQSAASVELTARDLCSLWQEGVAQGVKSTFASVVPVHDLLHLCDETFRVIYGSFQSPMEALLGGAHGWISGFLNFLTRDCVALYEACAAGDVAEARRVWNFLLRFKQLYTHQLLGPINDLAIYRAGLELMGQTGGYSRLPFEPLTSSQRDQLEALMKEQHILT